MSQENVELARVTLEDFRSATDESSREAMLTRISQIWDSEIEWDASELPLPDTSGIYRGREAVGSWWREWLAAWETTQFEYELVDAGHRVVILLDQRMRGRSTGIEVPLGKYAQVATFRNGLVVHWKLYATQADALEAVGLSE